MLFHFVLSPIYIATTNTLCIPNPLLYFFTTLHAISHTSQTTTLSELPLLLPPSVIFFIASSPSALTEEFLSVRKNQYDYLIIDESESIFNIISSTTLIKSCFTECLKKLEILIQLCTKVVVMDAFLSERSIKVVENIKMIGNRLLREKNLEEKKQQEMLKKHQECKIFQFYITYDFHTSYGQCHFYLSPSSLAQLVERGTVNP